MEKNRIEAFSDGVLAVAITLLVLDLSIPIARPGQLAVQLGHEWPRFAAYGVSFLVIGIIWVNHHTLFSLLRRVDRPMLFVNLFLLAVVVLIPFGTSLLADNLSQGGSNAKLAAAVYSAIFVLMAAGFSAMYVYMTRDGRLLRPDVDLTAARASRLRFGAGGIVYLALVGVAFVNAYLTLACHFALAAYYVFNRLPVPLSPAEAEEADS